MYAYGADYHKVIKKKLKELQYFITENFGDINIRGFVDSAPVMDKAWAEKSGLGWIGKHSNLINKEKGSYFFIAELILDLELDTDLPIKDYCGTCTKSGQRVRCFRPPLPRWWPNRKWSGFPPLPTP